MTMDPSSPTMTTQAPETPLLAFLTSDRFPEARWHLGGAFRFDFVLQNLVDFLQKQTPGLFTLSGIGGAPPCLWTIDWFRQRPLANLQVFQRRLEDYARAGTGVTVEFDSPVIGDDELRDAAANRLLQELYQRDRVRKNAVAVANDKLARHIRRELPKLPLYAHVNRAVMEKAKRTADFYNKLTEHYDLVTLHPADCTDGKLLDGLEDPSRFMIVINDTCLRGCPVRREHMALLAQLRRRPLSAELSAGRARFLQTTGCESIDRDVLRQNRTLSMTEQDIKSLYERGIVHLIVQDASLRNEVTVIWETLRALFGSSPELAHKIGCLLSSFMAGCAPSMKKLPSGLGRFSFGNYD